MIALNIYLVFLTAYFLASYNSLQNDIKKFRKDNLINLLSATIKQISINIFIVYPGILLVFFNFTIYSNEFKFIKFIFDLFFNNYVYDCILYVIHKNIHKYFFEIHKKRHDILITAGFTVFYANSIDFILINIIPLYTGLILVNANIYVYYFHIFVDTYLLVYGSSRIGKRASFYDYHNRYFFSNYGIDMFMDKYFETYFTTIPL